MSGGEGFPRRMPAVVDDGCGESERRRGRYCGRVLLVSASHFDRESYADYLRREGFCVIERQVASEAFDVARAVLLRAVVTEVRLPGKEGGLWLTRRLKESPALCRLPVVVLTELRFGSIHEEFRAAGCDAFLFKPCSPQALSDAVRSLPHAGTARRARQARTI